LAGKEAEEMAVEAPILIGCAAENIPPSNEAQFIRVTVEPWVLRIAFQLRQFKTVDLSDWL